MFICRLRLPSPGHRRGKCRTAASPKLFTFREAAVQCSPVSVLPLPKNHDSLKEDTRLLFWGLSFLLEAFAFGFGAFGFLMWEALEGKIIVEGKRIAEGELLASLRAKILRKLKREHGTVQVYTKNFIHRL
jgi:hypothetical protein